VNGAITDGGVRDLAMLEQSPFGSDYAIRRSPQLPTQDRRKSARSIVCAGVRVEVGDLIIAGVGAVQQDLLDETARRRKRRQRTGRELS
jgi:regulator of RNase E activity RraA